MHAVVWKEHGYCPKNSVFFKVRRSPTPWRPLQKDSNLFLMPIQLSEHFSRGFQGVGDLHTACMHLTLWGAGHHQGPSGTGKLLRYWNQFYASLDGSVRQEMLLCSGNPFYASLDWSVKQEMLLCSWNPFYASLDGSVQQAWLLCIWNQFYASLDRSVRQEMLWNNIMQVLTDICDRKCSYVG